ncbi:hypothetical protein PINS_up020400 [Pythium insidiosum]|nr:hypothetical protein PINS_up020400 [Pythium insidiosum]
MLFPKRLLLALAAMSALSAPSVVVEAAGPGPAPAPVPVPVPAVTTKAPVPTRVPTPTPAPAPTPAPVPTTKTPPTPTFTPPQRVRKSWNQFTAEEKQRYLSAVRRAMETGHQARFAQIHAERMNKINAHQNCGFTLWHRRFILAYENMLRSLAPEFASVTLPFWNYFEDTTKQMAVNVKCDSLGNCAQFLKDFGGGSGKGADINTARTQQTIGTEQVWWGACVKSSIAGAACTSTQGSAAACDKCILRGDWSAPNAIVQSVGTDMLTLLGLFTDSTVATSDAHARLSTTIESTFHNAVHNALSGVMSSMASPFDPVFYGHHTTVDMAAFIFNRCRYDPSGKLDVDNLPRTTVFDVFTRCEARERGAKVNDVVGASDMYLASNGVPVAKASETAGFFADMGTKYSDFANAEALGKHSYTYQLDAYLKNLLEAHNVRCPSYIFAAAKPPRARELVESTTTTTTTTTTNATTNPSTSTTGVNATSPAATAVANEVTSTLAACGEEIARAHPEMSFAARIEQEGVLKCLVIRAKNHGVVEDYSPIFRQQFMLSPADKPYCLGLLERVDRGELPVLASSECKQRYAGLTGVDAAQL